MCAQRKLRSVNVFAQSDQRHCTHSVVANDQKHLEVDSDDHYENRPIQIY